MNIKLTAIKAPANTPITGQIFTLSHGHSIGRGPDNDLTLADESRVISSLHAKIQIQNDQFSLIDKSTNGTFINGSANPIGKENSHSLKNGDVIAIGHYLFSVETVSSKTLPDGLEAVGFLDNPIDSPRHTTPLSEASNQNSVDEYDKWLEPSPNSAQASPWGSVGPNILTSEDSIAAMMQEPTTDPLAAFDNLLRSTSMDANDGNLFGDPASAEAEDNWWQSEVDVAPANQAAMPKIKVVSELNAAITTPRRVEPVARPSPEDQAVAPPISITPETSTSSAELSSLLGLTGISADQEALLVKSTAAIVRSTTTNLVNLLQARASIKNELRASHTIIQTQANNPLKFSAGADDALRAMFCNSSKAFLAPEEAVKESFEDVADHQVAVLYAMKIAFNYMLAQFHPQNLEKEFNKQNKSILENLKTTNWGEYNKLYSELQSDRESSYHKLFGHAFSKAYETKQTELKLNRQSTKYN